MIRIEIDEIGVLHCFDCGGLHGYILLLALLLINLNELVVV